MSALLIDTNLLCLLVVGLWNKKQIRLHKRLQIYGVEDFERIVDIIELYNSVVLCPHVLAETSNIIRLTNDHSARAAGAKLAELIEKWSELNQPSTTCTARPEYERLGLTDAMLLELASGGITLLSDDAKLCLAATTRGYTTINYNYVRDGSTRLDQI